MMFPRPTRAGRKWYWWMGFVAGVSASAFVINADDTALWFVGVGCLAPIFDHYFTRYLQRNYDALSTTSNEGSE